jgi:hypothetical protein
LRRGARSRVGGSWGGRRGCGTDRGRTEAGGTVDAAGPPSDGFCPLLPPLDRECLPFGRLPGASVAVSLPLIIFSFSP